MIVTWLFAGWLVLAPQGVAEESPRLSCIGNAMPSEAINRVLIALRTPSDHRTTEQKETINALASSAQACAAKHGWTPEQTKFAVLYASAKAGGAVAESALTKLHVSMAIVDRMAAALGSEKLLSIFQQRAPTSTLDTEILNVLRADPQSATLARLSDGEHTAAYYVGAAVAARVMADYAERQLR
jgi:hypothetical protein